MGKNPNDDTDDQERGCVALVDVSGADYPISVYSESILGGLCGVSRENLLVRRDGDGE